MPFMERDIYHGDYYAVEANHGETHIIPADVVGRVTTAGELRDYVNGTIDEPDVPITALSGWLARLSAPGYMDCTDWTAHETEGEAIAYLDETYGDNDADDNNEDED